MAVEHSFADVAKHNNKNDVWVVIHNKVYDVTKFVDEHPGGAEVLVEEAGKNATEAFEDIGHSEEAREILEKYHIGDLRKADHVNVKVSLPAPASEDKPKKSSLSRLILPTILIAGIVAYKVFASRRR